MRILLVHKFLYPKGGAETYVLKLGDMLRARGHEVQYFGLDNPKNTVGNAAEVNAADIDFCAGIRRNLHAPLRIIYNADAARKLRRVLEDFAPHAVHFNNIQFHLTPSVILAAEKYRQQRDRELRIVLTAHDYQLICPSHGLFDGKLRVCEKCLNGHYLHCLRGRCLKDSYLKSFLAALDGYFWKYSPAYDYIDTIICPSEFLRSKLDAQPRFRSKTVTVRNFVDPAPVGPTEKGGYVLQFGHLSKDKGTFTLLEAAKRLPQVRFVFAGFGEAVEEIGKRPNCDFVGFKTGAELSGLIAGASVSVCPSEIYENCPFSVLESMLQGTPVIGARIGGIPELIREGENGELFQAGNAAELEEKLRKLLFTPHLAARYGENCRKAEFETPDSYCNKLLSVYGGTYENL